MNATGDKPQPANLPHTTPVRGLNPAAWLAALFCLLICATLLYLHFRATTSDPWKSPQLLALKDRLVAEPKNEALKDQIRRLDYEFRRQFRRRLALDHSAAWLLLGGAFLTVVVAKKAGSLKRPLPFPALGNAASNPRELQSRALWSVALTAGVVSVAFAMVSFAVGTGLPFGEKDWQKALAKNGATEPGAAQPPSTNELRANWPGFRGWDGSGVTDFTNAPLSWDGKSGRGIAWKSMIPAQGNSSPVVWSNQVFVSGATADKREVFAYDSATGRLLWRCEIAHVPGSPLQKTEVGETTGFAASTGATDGRYFYAIFANGDLAAVNFDGGIAWSKALGPLKNPYGHASSLVARQGMLIVQLDQGESSKTFSKLLALEAGTGRVKWERSRPVPASWATPIIIEASGKTQIVALGEPWVIGYAFADGTELWRANLLQSEVVPSPIFASGLVIAVNPNMKLIAIRADGSGDVTKSGVAWDAGNNVPDITSPVSNGELIFTVNSGGGLTCLDARNGHKIWDHELDLNVQASPVIMGNRLLVLSENGVAVQVEVGREFKQLSRSELPDKFVASPAFTDGRIFLRGETNLFCLQSDISTTKGALAHAGH